MAQLLRLVAVATIASAAALSRHMNTDCSGDDLSSGNLPRFLPDGSGSTEVPWANFDPAGEPPDTGVTRHYEFTVSRDFASPDGFNKSVILINGQFPGPMIEANWGDMIEVKVTNDIDSPDEGITLHWHGLTQKKTPWYDGVPGVSQCPIAPRGGKLTYRFQADRYGSGWYHSHYSAQYDDGLFGPVIIHGPVQPEAEYDFDLGPVMISDYYHVGYYEIMERSLAKPPGIIPLDNNLINGKGSYNCNRTSSASKCLLGAGYEKFRFHSGKRHRLRLINSGALANEKFSIDNHEMTVIANDFVPVKPHKTKVVTLSPGQRTDVIVHATSAPNDIVWMRADMDMVCLQNTATFQTARAAIYYESADTKKLPHTKGTTWESNDCRNDPLELTVPYYPLTPPAPTTTQTVTVTAGLNGTGFMVMFMDNSSFRANYNQAALLEVNQGRAEFPADRNVYDFGSNSSVRLVIENAFETLHPMHLHGHDFWVLSEGPGPWDGTVVNPENPLRRDTHLMQPGTPENPSHLVLQWNQDNPGVWPLHCHISIHSSAGMVILVMERPDDIVNEMAIPPAMDQTCEIWDNIDKSDYAEQIDSGV
ncbi:hypothetical protein P170DRAFT_407094 [Aspergillus steynii IBT 23096]|uniref:Multicopper oxidase n=1 Tax=Aspergillus steynii IBT 23096 TaxID=1392250 RepID=A0A2I2GEK5_9EURO|nr:uncharacterized protein P170DRAFT_407094 [Aspergillus steynii IBT 23096]PLB51300.1 hypothetical protein P170DRAFT_407094 [Aspergillus steynii IBT 23096]